MVRCKRSDSTSLMLLLRLFASVVLAVSLGVGVACAWVVVEVETSYTFDQRGALLHCFDLRDWTTLVAWSCVGFLLASIGGVTSALGLLAMKRWSRATCVASVSFASVIAAIDWFYAGTPLEILWAVGIGMTAVISWWLLYRHALAAGAIARHAR